VNELSYIKMEALHLLVGETTHANCCFCHSDKKKLSITRTPEGILYNCWRSSCSGRGFIGSVTSNIFAAEWQQDEFRPDVYRAETTLLTPHMITMLRERYHMSQHAALSQGFKVSEVNVLVMPLYNRKMEQFGYTTKHMTNKAHKAHHYISKKEVLLHYTSTACSNHNAVVVEDVLSAVRITQLNVGWRGIALLGTDVNHAKMESLSMAGVKHLMIALDPDAIDKAWDIQSKWGVFFNTCTVRTLREDPKDLSPADLKAQLVL